MIDELHTYIHSLRRYAYVLCRNAADSDDLVQETLTKAIARAQTFRAGMDLRAWLFGILHNTFVSDKRQYARRARAAKFLENAVPEPDTTSDQEKHVEAETTIRMLSRLTADQQAALILVAVEGLSYEEAAAILDVPVGTLMSRLARGREQLRRLVRGQDPSPLRAVR